MAMQCVVASDLGSSGCKTVVVGAGGKTLGSASQDYVTHYPHPGWAEQNPADWLDAVAATVPAALAAARVQARDVACYGVVGVTHNAVLLDARGEVLRPTILLFDSRCVKQSETLAGRHGATTFARTCNSMSPLWTWPQLQWVRENEPDVFQRIAKILFQKDYVRHCLAPSLVTDHIDAAGSLLFNPLANHWVDEFLSDLGLATQLLPDVVVPSAVVSRLGATGAARVGLMEGTPVIAGSTDTAAEVLGAGAVRVGQGTVKLASVGRITTVLATPLAHPKVLNYRHVLDGLWYPGTATKYASTAYQWLRDVSAPGATFAEMSAAAQQAPPGAEGLLFLPYMGGEWAPHWDERLRGAFIGLNITHGRGHLCRAVMEGVSYALLEAMQFGSECGMHFNQLRLLGGGATSADWSQALADILGRTLVVPRERSAAYGAALLTGIGCGMFEATPQGVEAVVEVEREFRPRDTVRGLYRELSQVYHDAANALRPVSHRLAGLRETALGQQS